MTKLKGNKISLQDFDDEELLFWNLLCQTETDAIFTYAYWFSVQCLQQLTQKKSKQKLFFIFVWNLISKLDFVSAEYVKFRLWMLLILKYRLVRPPRNGSIQEVRPDMAARPAEQPRQARYRDRRCGSRRDRGSDEKYSDINGRLSRKTGRPGHCHYIQVKSIQNLNFLFEYVFWNLKNFTFWIVYLQLLLVLKANVCISRKSGLLL